MVSLREDLTGTNPPPPGSGIERTGMLDAFAHDTRDDVLVLAMFAVSYTHLTLPTKRIV